MCDLISRQKLIDDIFKLKCLTEKSKEWFAEIVKNQPTAYDVDKVVEQLEEACISPSDYPGYTVDIEKAIDIVKGEWRL